MEFDHPDIAQPELASAGERDAISHQRGERPDLIAHDHSGTVGGRRDARCVVNGHPHQAIIVLGHFTQVNAHSHRHDQP